MQAPKSAAPSRLLPRINKAWSLRINILSTSASHPSACSPCGSNPPGRRSRSPRIASTTSFITLRPVTSLAWQKFGKWVTNRPNAASNYRQPPSTVRIFENKFRVTSMPAARRTFLRRLTSRVASLLAQHVAQSGGANPMLRSTALGCSSLHKCISGSTTGRAMHRALLKPTPPASHPTSPPCAGILIKSMTRCGVPIGRQVGQSETGTAIRKCHSVRSRQPLRLYAIDCTWGLCRRRFALTLTSTTLSKLR